MNLGLRLSISGAQAVGAPGVSLSISATSIAESASPGDSIGTLSASGGVGPYTYAIDTDTDAKFAIGGAGSDELVIRTGASLDYETATSHSVMIQITDTGDGNATYLKTLTITVIDVPAPIADGTLIDLTLSSGIAMSTVNVALDFTGPNITYALAPSSAALPTGLSLSSAGLITGTPTTPASAVTIVIRGTNSEDFADSAFQITVQGDVTAPDVTINSVANDEVNYTTNEAGTAYWLVNASATALGGSTIEAGGGSASGTFAVGSSGTTTETLDLSALSDGTYYMHLTIKDAAGNYSTDVPQSFDYTSAATAPSAFTSGQWSIADDGTGGDATITITALPSDGGSAITDLEAKVGAGAWTSLGGTTTGTYGLTDSFTDGVSTNVLIRAVNAVGNGPDSDTKSVTTTAPSFGIQSQGQLINSSTPGTSFTSDTTITLSAGDMLVIEYGTTRNTSFSAMTPTMTWNGESINEEVQLLHTNGRATSHTLTLVAASSATASVSISLSNSAASQSGRYYIVTGQSGTPVKQTASGKIGQSPGGDCPLNFPNPVNVGALIFGCAMARFSTGGVSSLVANSPYTQDANIKTNATLASNLDGVFAAGHFTTASTTAPSTTFTPDVSCNIAATGIEVF